MKVLASISLAILYLFSATGLAEVGKLPELYEHYQEHQEEEGEITILDFLEMHYLGEGHEGDHEHDLPFQHDVDYIVVNIPAITPSTPLSETLSVRAVPLTSWPQVKDFLPSELSFEIWNPPRG